MSLAKNIYDSDSDSRLLLTFLLCLHNQLVSIHSIFTFVQKSGNSKYCNFLNDTRSENCVLLNSVEEFIEIEA